MRMGSTLPPASPDLPGTLAWDPAFTPDLSQVVTEDDTPLDSIYTEKQQRLLTEPLYSSWPGPGEGRPFLAVANVGLFHTQGEPATVPDAMLSLDVRPAADLWVKQNRSYFLFVFGKPPDAVIEIVSDRRGGEDDFKSRLYARIGVPFYVIYDPEEHLEGGVLRAFALERGKYVPTDPRWLEELGLGLVVWEGPFEGVSLPWLRWCDRQGRVIPTGAERAEEERRRADDERRRADEAEEKARRLAERLRTLGQEP
jgi:Uma2 family endonuclease